MTVIVSGKAASAIACSVLLPSIPGLPLGMLISNKRRLANKDMACPNSAILDQSKYRSVVSTVRSSMPFWRAQRRIASKHSI